MRQRSVALVLLFLASCLAAPALAHDTWLLPRRARVAPGASVAFDLTSGMNFPAPDTAIRPERVARAKYRIGGATHDITDLSPAKSSLLLKATLAGAGVAAVWVELKPRSLELTPAEVSHYLDEIDAPEDVRRAWADAPEPRRWRETYVKHSKSFVRVGAGGADGSWAEPVGLPLEIVPEVNPTELRAGDDFPVRVLKNGAPLPNFSVGVVREGNTSVGVKRTDARGRAVFRLGRAGRWLLRGTELRKSAAPGVDWESDFTTLTLEVAARGGGRRRR